MHSKKINRKKKYYTYIVYRMKILIFTHNIESKNLILFTYPYILYNYKNIG